MRIGIILAAHKERGNDGGDDADRGNDEGIERTCALEQRALRRDAERQRGDERAHVGFKEVRAHAGDVAHVVADVVGNDGGVAGVVLGYAGLDLADEVSADVCCLGVNAAADAREQRDGRSAQGEAEQNVVIAGDYVYKAASEKTQTDHAHTHDRAAGERDGQSAVHAVLHRGVRGAHVRARRDLHAEKPGEDRERRAQQEAHRRADVDEQRDQRKQHDNENSQNLIF